MKIFRNLRWLLLAAVASPAAANLGCGVTVNAIIPAASGLTAAPKPPDCKLDFFWTTPDRPYQELAAVSLQSAVPSDYVAYQAALHVQACALGADAVIVLFPFSSREGIVVKYRQAPAQGEGGSGESVAKVRAREQAAGAAAHEDQH
jgi:hypothetical protein